MKLPAFEWFQVANLFLFLSEKSVNIHNFQFSAVQGNKFILSFPYYSQVTEFWFGPSWDSRLAEDDFVNKELAPRNCHVLSPVSSYLFLRMLAIRSMLAEAILALDIICIFNRFLFSVWFLYSCFLPSPKSVNIYLFIFNCTHFVTEAL